MCVYVIIKKRNMKRLIFINQLAHVANYINSQSGFALGRKVDFVVPPYIK